MVNQIKSVRDCPACCYPLVWVGGGGLRCQHCGYVAVAFDGAIAPEVRELIEAAKANQFGVGKPIVEGRP